MRSTHRADRVGPAVYYPQLNQCCRRKGPFVMSPDIALFAGVAGCADPRAEVSDLLCIGPVWRGKVSPPSAQFPDHRLGFRGSEVVHIRATIDGGFKEHRRAICKLRAPAPAWPAAGRLSQTPSAILRIIFLNLFD